MNDNILFPDSFFRGLSAKDQITEEGYITASAFQFSEFNSELRDNDNFRELSIQWNDDKNALETLLKQEHPQKGGLQFKVGYCSIKMDKMVIAMMQYLNDGTFSYERRPIEEDKDNNIPENPYHGNLLLSNSSEKQVKKNIQHMLAGLASREDVVRID